MTINWQTLKAFADVVMKPADCARLANTVWPVIEE
jgi:hypothetical protein